MMISAIAACGSSGQIGFENSLLWKLPTDMKYFVSKTKGHHLLMGRKTFESLPGILPGRPHLVITRNPNYHPKGALTFSNVEEAIAFASSEGERELFVIGGAQLYCLTINLWDKLYLTRVQDNPRADRFFPELKSSFLVLTQESYIPKDELNPYNMTFETWIKQ